MRRSFILTAILGLLVTSCVKEDINDNNINNNSVNITGTTMKIFSDNQSRAESISNLVENDSIIFSSNGGIIADRDTLVYKGSKWNGLKRDKWETNKENADYCAIHPILKEYNETHLYYKNNELRDIICCKSTGEYGKGINLSFYHLFSKIQINIDNELNNSIDKIYISVPHSINNIDIKTGKVTLNDNIKNVVLERNESSRYEIFVPPHDNQTISLEIQTKDGKTYNATINNKSYISGYQYVCNVKYNNGIYTKEDFIAFSHLINGNEYKGRKLDEFFILKDGKRVFNLFADLNFNKEETELIQGIGDYPEENFFNDIFDGNNHTISGIEYYSDSQKRNRIAIFENTSENAIIRNIKLENCSFTETTSKFYSTACFLVGYNNGIIDNCTVNNSKLSSINSKQLSVLCSVNYGYIINSSIGTINAIDNESRIGGICTANNGYILNCRIYSNIITQELNKISAITCRNTKVIENVYNYGYSKYNYIIDEIEYRTTNNNIFFNKKFETNNHISYKYSPSKLENYITHNDTSEDYIKNIEQLNNWVETIGKSKYPNFKFMKWVYDGSSVPRLE